MQCTVAISSSGHAYKEFNVVNCMSLFWAVKDSTIVAAFSNSSAPKAFHTTVIICMLFLIFMHIRIDSHLSMHAFGHISMHAALFVYTLSCNTWQLNERRFEPLPMHMPILMSVKCPCACPTIPQGIGRATCHQFWQAHRASPLRCSQQAQA